jgi:hypothetical protein
MAMRWQWRASGLRLQRDQSRRIDRVRDQSPTWQFLQHLPGERVAADRPNRRTSPWEWRLVDRVNVIVVAAWRCFGFLLPPSVPVPVNGLAAHTFGAVQFAWCCVLLLKIARLADRMAGDSRRLRTMARGLTAMAAAASSRTAHITAKRCPCARSSEAVP